MRVGILGSGLMRGCLYLSGCVGITLGGSSFHANRHFPNQQKAARSLPGQKLGVSSYVSRPMGTHARSAKPPWSNCVLKFFSRDWP
jgi:hypothetical protein